MVVEEEDSPSGTSRAKASRMELTPEQITLLDAELARAYKEHRQRGTPVELELTWVSMKSGIEATEIGRAITAHAPKRGYFVSAAMGIVRNFSDHTPAWPIINLLGKALIPIDLINAALDVAEASLKDGHDDHVAVGWPDLATPLPTVDDAKQAGREFYEVARERGLDFRRDGEMPDDVHTGHGVIKGFRPLMNLYAT